MRLPDGESTTRGGSASWFERDLRTPTERFNFSQRISVSISVERDFVMNL